MHALGARWAIVLAAGEGTRLRSLTTDHRGVATPKQYCALRGCHTLLQDALARAQRIVPAERIVVVVAAEHERWWARHLAHLPADNVIVQPRNRGTAPGLLLPLLHVLGRDPQARIAVLPSDHFVRDEETLARALRQGLEATDKDPDTVVLLGITPDAPEPEYGWIVPRIEPGHSLARVTTFVEKPPRSRAQDLLTSGGLWNSFLLAGRGAALLHLYRQRLPALTLELRGARAGGSAAVHALYDRLDSADFSRDVLQASADSLRALAVPECGWTDLGTPQRVAECLAQLAPAVDGAPSPWHAATVVDLSEALAAAGV